MIESISKMVLGDRFREGISSYYIHLHKKKLIPDDVNSHVYWFMYNLRKPQSELNYTPIVMRGDFIDDHYFGHNPEKELIMNIDIKDPILIDFLLNNKNTDLWIRIYDVVYNKKIDLNMFENIIFDYTFNKGMSVKDIAKITGNSYSWVYSFRRDVIKKIKNAVDGINNNIGNLSNS